MHLVEAFPSESDRSPAIFHVEAGLQRAESSLAGFLSMGSAAAD